MKNLRIVITLVLPVLLGGCLPDTQYPNEPYYNESMTRAQIEQTKIQMKQRQKITQKNKSQTINIYQQNQPYHGYPEMLNNADRLAETRAQQQERARRIEEARQQDQLRQISYARSREEQARRQELAAQEARDIEQGIQNSYLTARQEQARRQEHTAQQAFQREEARQMEQAKQESLRTFAEEEARRHQTSPIVKPAASVVSPPEAPVASAIPAPISKWKPSEYDLVQAGNHVMELKIKNEGRIPSHSEMSSHIQMNMSLTPEQSDRVLKKLGL